MNAPARIDPALLALVKAMARAAAAESVRADKSGSIEGQPHAHPALRPLQQPPAKQQIHR